MPDTSKNVGHKKRARPTRLKRRLGEHAEIEAALPHLQRLELEALAEALLDFGEIGELSAWLRAHGG